MIRPVFLSLINGRAPRILLGALLVFASSLVPAGETPDLRLAESLMNEEAWSACRVECMRILAAHNDAADAVVMKSVCELQVAPRLYTNAVLSLKQVFENQRCKQETRFFAGYVLSGELHSMDRDPEAVTILHDVFVQTSSPWLFARSGCRLYQLLKQDNSLRESREGLWQQLLSASPAWNADVWEDSRCEKSSGQASTGAPGRLLIGFYRTQIRPVLGQRCSLLPSCSEYARQGFNKFGLLGFPIIADRFYREPSVVAAARDPVRVGNEVLYPDPLEKHTWWLEPGKERHEPAKE